MSSKYTTYEGMNLNTYNKLIDGPSECEDATIDMELSKGLFEVDYYSYYKHNWLNNIIHALLITPILFPRIHPHIKKPYHYKSDTEEFDFIPLHKYLKVIAVKDPYIGKKLLQNYKKAARASTCQYSIIIACMLEGSELKMGLVPLKDGRKALHRFVVIEHEGTPYVIDIAKNIIMKKDEYYKYSRFEELSSIKSEDLTMLFNFCAENSFCNHTKIISMFGPEIIKELEKNNMIKAKHYTLPNFSCLID